MVDKHASLPCSAFTELVKALVSALLGSAFARAFTSTERTLFDFYRAVLCVSAIAVARCPSVCPSVRHTRVLYQTAKIILNFSSQVALSF